MCGKCDALRRLHTAARSLGRVSPRTFLRSQHHTSLHTTHRSLHLHLGRLPSLAEAHPERVQMPLFHGKGAKAVKFTFELSDVQVHLNSASSVAVAVDNVVLTWERGRRSVSAKRARVVEKLDQLTGSLTRTAPLLGSELALPCTLFRFGGSATDDEGGRWGSKVSEFKLLDADAEADEALLCTVSFELSTHAASSAEPVYRTRVELPLGGDLGSIAFSLCSRLLFGVAADDGCSNAGSDGCSNADVIDPRALDEATAEAAAAPAVPPAIEMSQGASATHRQQVEHGVEARWQEVYELERSKADALTIEALHKDLGALIRDKQRLSEENLKLRSMVSASVQPKRMLVERIGELEADVARLKREAVANEERQATAFNSVIRALEEEVASLTSQRDDAVKAVAAAANERRRRLSSLVHAAGSNGSQNNNVNGFHHHHQQQQQAPQQRSPTQSNGDDQLVDMNGNTDGTDGKSRGRKIAGSLRRTLSFESKSARRIPSFARKGKDHPPSPSGSAK